MKINIGLDIGSISVNAVVMDPHLGVKENHYLWCMGRPFHVAVDILKTLAERYGMENIHTVAFTGSGGEQAARLTGGTFVNEIIAQSGSIAEYYPEARTVIEMGGEDSKLIFMEKARLNGHSRLSDFSLNSLCAAGTGSFLDQQAKRIGVSIENEFGELALQSKKPPRIAGRCSVFAKSDMIHLQQIATPLHDIVAGLCFAVARNFKSTLGRGKTFHPPFVFQGGVAANKGMTRAFSEVFGIPEGELIIPAWHASMGAIGALLHTLKNPDSQGPYRGTGELEDYLRKPAMDGLYHDKLSDSQVHYIKEPVRFPEGGEKLRVSLGIDVGSLSTNVVLIDKDNNVVARRYLPTASKPIEAIQRGLREIYEEAGEKVEVCSAGTTGSGRYLTGDFIGADTIRNEITAQATAAIAFDPEVDTIFEIGGQDSKYISIRNGVIVDFEMNKVCAAGTGSFLEEQAEKLGIDIAGEFSDLAFSSQCPVQLGDRCTVFMESDLNSQQQKGNSKHDLVAGLAYSIVQNYLQKVVGEKKIGDKIFFQGGVTNNKAVVAAFRQITGKPVIIPPHFDVTGAIGAAILARKAVDEGGKTQFRGFHLSSAAYKVDNFTCHECTNDCEIQRVRIDGEKKALFYGGRCEKYEKEDRKRQGTEIPDYFEERLSFLLAGYVEEPVDERRSIGIPRSLMLFYQEFPFWNAFFRELGFRVVLSSPSDQKLVKQSIEVMVSETCLPVELAHGHVLDLLKKNVDFIFMPFIINAKGKDSNPTNNPNCPWVQTYPFMIRAAFKDEKTREKFLMPALHFRYGSRVINEEMARFLSATFGIPRSATTLALRKAGTVQAAFEERVQRRGREVMASLPSGARALVLLGRPYNTGDPFLNLRLGEKLIGKNAIPIPLDYLPLEEEDIFGDYHMMYWPNGQRILAGARIIARTPGLHAVYAGNFRCGPDSFITHFVREEMKDKPWLHLEVDEHSADAGMITRIEAFLDSLDGYYMSKNDKYPSKNDRPAVASKLDGRVLYFPYARDTVHALAAAARSCGIASEVLPMTGPEDVRLARKMTNGQECFPLVCTTGSFIRKILEPGADPEKMAFFMPDHNGPCRFGEYNKLHRILFDRLGFSNVEIITPSNDNSYAELVPGKAGRFRLNAWKGIVAIDILKKLLQERKPYELVPGTTRQVYDFWLNSVISSVEQGSKGLSSVLEEAGKSFAEIPLSNGHRKPLIAILGETFMRDNPYCSGFVVDKLEALGAETIMGPFSEWPLYSTYRYQRDSHWKRDPIGVVKAMVQMAGQRYTAGALWKKVLHLVDAETEVNLEEMIRHSAPYIHKDYDGDPVIAIGSAARLAETGIDGVVYILPFTCMPGTLVTSLSTDVRNDHYGIPWENIAFDGQEDASLDIRLQAFMHQAREFAVSRKRRKPSAGRTGTAGVSQGR